jgi:hypothetical protein
VGHTPLQSDGLVLRPPGGFAAAARIATLPVLYYFGSSFEGTYLADAGYVTSIPFNLKLEVLVGIETLCINAELCHFSLPPHVWI